MDRNERRRVVVKKKTGKPPGEYLMLMQSVPCPDCPAPVGYSCKTTSGQYFGGNGVHAARRRLADPTPSAAEFTGRRK